MPKKKTILDDFQNALSIVQTAIKDKLSPSEPKRKPKAKKKPARRNPK
jgi:hypothetical protein